MQRLVAIFGQVMVDVLRVDDAAIFKQDAPLLAIETYLVPFFNDGLASRVMIQDLLYRLAINKMLGHNLFNITRLNLSIKGLIRVNNHNWALFTKAKTAGAAHLYLVAKPLFV